MMIGWQTLAPEKHRTSNPEMVMVEVARVHPGVWETQERGDYAYWVGPSDSPRLVGVAWCGSDESWSYAIMNETAFEMGICCALEFRAGKNRIVPALPIRPKPAEPVSEPVVSEPVTTAPEPAAESLRQSASRQSLKAVTRRVYQQGGYWFAKVESRTHLRELGPFASKIEAKTRASLVRL